MTDARRTVPAGFREARDRAVALAFSVPGYLSAREARFLYLAAACTPVDGPVVEIGSFKGRSTVVLAAASKAYDRDRVLAVDPHDAPSPTDPSLGTATSSWDAFLANIAGAGVADHVTAARMLSADFAPTLSQAVRLLWVDGDHTVAGARADLRLFLPHLAHGGILAMHDVLGTWEGSLRVFCEDVLASDRFGAAGFCGSIGWAQYLPDGGVTPRHRMIRSLIAIPARKLIPIAQTGRGLVGWNTYRYKFWRPLAPHGEIHPHRWVRKVALT